MKDLSTNTDESLRSRYDEIIKAMYDDIRREDSDPSRALSIAEFDKLFWEGVAIVDECNRRRAAKVS